MTTHDESPATLPDAAVDHGEHIEIRPTKGSRVLSAVVGGAFAVLGAVILVLGPGDVDGLLARIGLGGSMLVLGIVVLVLRTQRLRLDAGGLERTSLVRSRSLNWDQVSRLALEERLEPGGPLGGVTRRVGFLTVSTGPGGRRGTGVGAARTQRVVRLVASTRGDGNSIAMELNGADLDEGRALVDELRERSWLPNDVEVTLG